MTFISWRTIALISGTEYVLSRSTMRTSSCGPSTMRYDAVSIAFFTCGDVHLRPMRRLAA